jgi:hypothetical protein
LEDLKLPEQPTAGKSSPSASTALPFFSNTRLICSIQIFKLSTSDLKLANPWKQNNESPAGEKTTEDSNGKTPASSNIGIFL